MSNVPESYVHCLEHLRWRGLPRCPYCTSIKSSFLKESARHHCNTCNTHYSVMVGTPFHHTHVGLEKWFLLINLLINTDTQYSSRQVAKIINVNKNTACRMIKRINVALLNMDHRKLLSEIASYDR